ncbi:MAG: hypothetical protein Q8R04_02460 [Nanoarchaeota archaeon]|nr:hypothetical protein [Nanoarchaeota archaeon]
MRVVISQKHLSLNERIAKESNSLVRNFNNRNYIKIEDIDNLLLKRDISVEKKKRILIKKLHEAVVSAFSIDKKKFNMKAFHSLKKRLHNIRKIVLKLRSINYYLETTFLEDLKLSKIKIISENPKLKRQNSLVRDELEALEYTAYRLIEEAVMLDKRLLKEYAHKEKTILGKERIEVKDLGTILRKETELMEHLEAKSPPPKAASAALIKEPVFTHWVARVFALLSYLEHLYAKEAIIFSRLKKNKTAKIRISKKISHLAKEKSKLLKIMEEKSISIKKFRMNNEFRKELHNLTTTISL